MHRQMLKGRFQRESYASARRLFASEPTSSGDMPVTWRSDAVERN